jgi:hypothetical protein
MPRSAAAVVLDLRRVRSAAIAKQFPQVRDRLGARLPGQYGYHQRCIIGPLQRSKVKRQSAKGKGT